jgi:hypothetical protein
VGGVFWRPIAIVWCFSWARFSSSPRRVAWNSVALAHLGPSSLPALVRLLDRPELQTWWCAREALSILHKNEPEANAAIHDLLASPSLRVRVAAGTVLARADDPSGLPATVEGLDSEDTAVRLVSAETVSEAFGSDALSKEVKHRFKVYERTRAVLEGEKADPRTVFKHGDIRGASVEGEEVPLNARAVKAFDAIHPEPPDHSRKRGADGR